jgi:hypothetical protein
MSLRARVIAILLMWTSIGLSCLLLGYFENGFGWIAWSVVIAGLIGTVFIMRFGKSALADVDSGNRNGEESVEVD